MKTHDRLAHWQSVYETKPSTSVSWYQGEASTSLTLVRPLVADHGEAILDVGGGASTFVDGLLAEHYTDISVLDISPAALDVARSRLGEEGVKVYWLAADLLTWVPDRRFGVWHDRAVLHFLTDEHDQARYADLMLRAIRPGGHAVIGTFAPGGPTECSGLKVQQFDADAVARLAGPAFDLVSSRAEDHVTPTGAIQSFAWTVLRRS